MESYNIDELSSDLKKMRKQGIKGKIITNIATAENVAQSTVYEYLDGNIAIPALATSILNRCRQIIIEKGKNKKNLVA